MQKAMVHSRRKFVSVLLAIVLVWSEWFEVPAVHGAEGRRPTLGANPTFPGAAAITFIDAHDHIAPGMDPSAIIATMDRLGVSKIVAMGNLTRGVKATARLALNAYEKYPQRVIPFIGLNFMDVVTRDIPEELDRELSTGRFLGVGELHGLHYGFEGRYRGAPDRRIPMDSPGAQDILCLAAKHNVVLVVHMETTTDSFPRLERALQNNPAIKVIWAHQNPVKTIGPSEWANARTADPNQIGALMSRYPNLYADIAPGLERGYMAESDRQLPDRWKSLYERYSGRFVVGLDSPFQEIWQDLAGNGGATAAASLIKDWLAQLSPQAREKLAYRNIERLLAYKPASIKQCEFSSPCGRSERCRN